MKKILCVVLILLCVCSVNLFTEHLQTFAESDVTVKAKSAILVDYNTGEVLFGQNENDKLEIASMVKLMTTYLTINAVENGEISLEDELTASEYASSMGGSQVFLDAGEKYNVEKMLQSVIMASANDASVALAEHISGSENAFVKKMNETAVNLGMTNTQYANATGLPAPMQYSCAKDTAIILSQLVPNKIYHKYSEMWMDSLIHNSGRKTEIVNTNKLTRYYKGCDCGKTGFTDEAGYCLASSVMRNDMRLVAVVIGAKSAKERFSESVNLFNYGFSNFTNELILDSTKSVGEIDVKKSVVTNANVFPSNNFFALTKKGENAKFDVKIDMQKSVTAPQQSGASVGVAIISNKDGVVIKEIPLVINEDISALTFGEAFNKVIDAWK